MNCSIVLVAYYSDNWLPVCIDSLIESGNNDCHLILVDNAGNALLDKLNFTGFDVEILRTPHPMGFAEANNFALSEATYLRNYVIFLNQDTISPGGWLRGCIKYLNRNLDFAAISPVIRNYDGTDWDPSFLSCLSTQQFLELEGQRSEQSIITTYIPAPAMIVRTSVLEHTGLFDPIYGSYYEDYDLCARITATGKKVGFLPTEIIYHFSGSSTDTPKKKKKRTRQILRNRFIYDVRHNGRPRGIVLAEIFSFRMVRRLGRSILNTASSQPGSAVLGAYMDFARLIPLLINGERDRQNFDAKMRKIGWPRTESR